MGPIFWDQAGDDGIFGQVLCNFRSHMASVTILEWVINSRPLRFPTTL